MIELYLGTRFKYRRELGKRVKKHSEEDVLILESARLYHKRKN